jgi:hypothetical protein
MNIPREAVGRKRQDLKTKGIDGKGRVESIMPKSKKLQQMKTTQKQNKLRGLSPQANYTERATAACRLC